MREKKLNIFLKSVLQAFSEHLYIGTCFLLLLLELTNNS